LHEDPTVDSDAIDAGLPEPALDEAGRLTDEVSCRHCGYNLRGLPVDQPCPECTTPVGRSVRGDMLRFSDPAWVECLARGARIYVLAIVIGFVLGLILGGSIAAMLAISGSIPALALIASAVVVLFVTALQIWAYWMITTPDPGRDESSRPITVRAIARYGLILSTVFGFAGTLVDPQVRGIAFWPVRRVVCHHGVPHRLAAGLRSSRDRRPRCDVCPVRVGTLAGNANPR
jgi:hypothetical protein